MNRMSVNVVFAAVSAKESLLCALRFIHRMTGIPGLFAPTTTALREREIALSNLTTPQTTGVFLRVRDAYFAARCCQS